MTHLHTSSRAKRRRTIKPYLLRILCQQLLFSKKLTTTLSRAKALQVFAEKLITVAKKNTLAAKRQIVAQVGAKFLQPTVTAAALFAQRNGGYTSIKKTHLRSCDAALMAQITLTA